MTSDEGRRLLEKLFDKVSLEDELRKTTKQFIKYGGLFTEIGPSTAKTPLQTFTEEVWDEEPASEHRFYKFYKLIEEILDTHE